MDKIDFVNAQQPAINDTNLNLMQDNIEREINAQVSGDTLPIGALLPFSGNSIPTNWLLCDGREISRTDYSQLFNVIGTRYGVGDGSTTFNLPNTKAKTIVGQDTSNTKFDTIGETGTVTDGTGDVQFLVQRYIIKAFQSAGTVAQILNAFTSSTTNTYSATYINNMNKYYDSTSLEIRIGTWFDGKPIYRKVIQTGQISSTSKSVAHNITSLGSSVLDTVVKLTGIAKSGSVSYTLPRVSTSNLNQFIDLRANATQIVLSAGSDANFDDSHVIIEYTKTTD